MNTPHPFGRGNNKGPLDQSVTQLDPPPETKPELHLSTLPGVPCTITHLRYLRVHALLWRQQLIDGINVRLGRSDHDIGIRSCPLTMRPPFSRRTVTSPCASVPVVMLLTEYNSKVEPVWTKDSMALKLASTAPLP